MSADVKFTFKYYSHEDAAGSYEVIRPLSLANSVRESAINIINEALHSGVNTWIAEINKDSAISIHLANCKSSSANKVYEHLDLGIKYDFDEEGGIIILDGFEPLFHDWTYGNILKLVESGYINGDVNHFIIYTPDGIGGSGYGPLDWLQFLSAVFGAVEQTRMIGSKVLRKITDRDIRKIAKMWSTNNIRYPHQIREFIDLKAEWKLSEIKIRLKLNEEQAVKLLFALGLEPVMNGWRLTHSDKSIKNRKNWYRNEAKYREIQENEG